MQNSETTLNGVLRVTLAGYKFEAAIENGSISKFSQSGSAIDEENTDLHIMFSDRAAEAMASGSFDFSTFAKSGDIKADGDRRFLPALGPMMLRVGSFLENEANQQQSAVSPNP